MNYDVLLVHGGLAVAMFFALNWIGKLAESAGYLTLDIFIKRDEAPAFNFVYRVFGPVVFLVVASCLLYWAKLDSYVESIWLVVPYQFAFRLFVNLSFGRLLLLNWRREVLLWTVSTWMSWILYVNIIKEKQHLFPDYAHISNHLWVLIALFLYATLNQVRFDEGQSRRRKNGYLYAAYGDNKLRYHELISSIAPNRLVESIAYSILLFEGFNRPKAARLVEDIAFPMIGKTLGPMQVGTERRISEEEGVRLGVNKVAEAYESAAKEGAEIAAQRKKVFDPTGNSSHRLFVILRVAAAYNRDDNYATEIEHIHRILAKEFYPEFAQPKLVRRSDYLI